VYCAVNLLTHMYQYLHSVLYVTRTATERTWYFSQASQDV